MQKVKKHIALKKINVPKGWQIVPVEPTEEMIEATFICEGINDSYRAMLRVAKKLARKLDFKQP
jgi:hypothetical protein